jgi:hypothetical protein
MPPTDAFLCVSYGEILDLLSLFFLSNQKVILFAFLTR